MKEYYELVKDNWNKARAEYCSKLHAVGLLNIDDCNYTGPGSAGLPYEPQSLEAWELHQALLTREGGVDDREAKRIREGVGRIKTAEKMQEILSELTDNDLVPSAIWRCDPVSKAYLQAGAGREELQLIAMQALGLDDTTLYSYLYQKLSIPRCVRIVVVCSGFPQRKAAGG